MTRDDRALSAVHTRPRVCVVDSGGPGVLYDRLDEVAVEVMAVVPRLGDVDLTVVGDFDLMIVGCSEVLLQNPIFERTIVRVAEYTRVVGVAPSPDPDLAARAARIGFHGFVAREVTPDAFERAIRAVLNGEMAFPRTTMSAVIRIIRRAYRKVPKAEQEVGLTPRQRQIVDLLAQGANDREIADVLRISPSTVHKHVQNALKRTNTRTRSHLAAAMGQPI